MSILAFPISFVAKSVPVNALTMFRSSLLALLISTAIFSIASCKNIETFEDFKQVYNKKYDNDQVESIRKHHFHSSLERLENIRKEHPSVHLGVNEYSDLSAEEFQRMFPEPHIKKVHGVDFNSDDAVYEAKKPLPQNFDWRDRIQFSPVSTQGVDCGACWAFSATAAAEALYAIKNRTKNLVLSKQEIVDCSDNSLDKDYRNHGCYFGYDTDAYKYMIKQGVMEEALYPYTGKINETCMREKIHAVHRYKLDDYHLMPFNISDQQIMELLIEKGPLTIDILALHDVFRYYKGGIIRYTYPYSYKINHAVLLVGYGHYEPLNIDYWIIRNSWGATWGEEGYARLERGYDQMGINNYISYAILN